MNAHFDVAAYALGVLDERDSGRFEDHLIQCAACAAELESMMPVVDLLSEVDPNSVIATEQSRKDGLVLKQMITTVGRERRRSRSRQLLSMAAAAVLVVALTAGALFAGGQWLAKPGGTDTGGTASAEWEPLPPNIGIGGPDLGPDGFSSTDPRTGVRADVHFDDKGWGTQVSFALSNVTGPRTCQLVAVRTTGAPVVLSTWTVPQKGYGTAQNKQPLLLQAATALPRKDIAYVQVQELGPNGQATTLVTAPDR